MKGLPSVSDPGFICTNGYVLLTYLTRLQRRKLEALGTAPGVVVDQEADHLAAALTGLGEHLAEAAVEVALESGEPMGQALAEALSREGSMELAQHVALLCERPGSRDAIALRRVAVTALDIVVAERRRRGCESEEDFGDWLTLQAGRWLQIGRFREGARIAREALDLDRERLQTSPSPTSLRLAIVLDGLGGALEQIGDLEEALRASREAVALLDGHLGGPPRDIAVLRAGFLVNLAARLRALGQRQEAVTVAKEGVETFRLQEHSGAREVQARLASALANLGVYLQETGQLDEAAVAAGEATEILDELARENPLASGKPGSYHPPYAAALTNLAILQVKLGDHDEALRNAQRACDIYEALPADDRAFRIDLAAALTNLVELLPDSTPPERSIGLAERALELWGERLSDDPMHEHRYALALNNLAGRLAACGRHEEALARARMAADRLAQATSQPTVTRPLLALTLNNLALRLCEAGEADEACRCQRRAVALYEVLSETQPRAFRAELARALLNLAARCEAVGAFEEAARAARRSAALHWMLGRVQPEPYRRSFTGALRQVAVTTLAHVEDEHQQARRTARKASSLYSYLAKDVAHPLRGELATAFDEIRQPFHRLGLVDELLATAKSTVAIALELFETSRRTHPGKEDPGPRNRLAVSLNQLGLKLRAMKRHQEALAAFRGAVGHFIVLDRERPEAFCPYLAATLHNRALVLQESGRFAEAMADESAAERLLEPFALREPAKYGPWVEEIRRFHRAAAEKLDAERSKTSRERWRSAIR